MNALLLLAAPALAAPFTAQAQSVSIKTADGVAREVSAAEFAGLPHTRLTLGKGEGARTYDGVTLNALLQKAGAPSGPNLRRADALSQVVLVTAADGYQVALSLAETDPEMRDEAVLLADRVDGALLPASEGPLRLIVDGDFRPARSARQVRRIEVIRLGATAPARKPAP